MRSPDKADHGRTGCDRAGHAYGRIFDDHASFDRNSELPSGVKIEVRGGLAAFDMIAAAVDVIAESIGEAEVAEMRPNPLDRARGSDGFREGGRQGPHEIDRP